MIKKICQVCDIEFNCGVNEDEQSCWCDSFPAIMPVESKQGCLCESCLALSISERINKLIKVNDYEKMVEISSQYRTKSKFIEHIDYTIEDGIYILSKWFLLKRGTCCGNNCRNCPYLILEEK